MIQHLANTDATRSALSKAESGNKIAPDAVLRILLLDGFNATWRVSGRLIVLQMASASFASFLLLLM